MQGTTYLSELFERILNRFQHNPMFWYPDAQQNDIFLACGNICLLKNIYFFIKCKNLIIKKSKQTAETEFVYNILTYTTAIGIFPIIEFQTRMIKS